MECTILIVDDHEIVRKGIRDIIRQSRPDWKICGEASTGAEAVEMSKALTPDVIILDIAMPGMSGIEAASQLARCNLACRVLLFTMYESNRLAGAAREVGAQGYVLKSQAAHHLVLAIDCILAGGTFFGSPEASGGSHRKKSSDRGPMLCKDMGIRGSLVPVTRSLQKFCSLRQAGGLSGRLRFLANHAFQP